MCVCVCYGCDCVVQWCSGSVQEQCKQVKVKMKTGGGNGKGKWGKGVVVVVVVVVSRLTSTSLQPAPVFIGLANGDGDNVAAAAEKCGNSREGERNFAPPLLWTLLSRWRVIHHRRYASKSPS